MHHRCGGAPHIHFQDVAHAHGGVLRLLSTAAQPTPVLPESVCAVHNERLSLGKDEDDITLGIEAYWTSSNQKGCSSQVSSSPVVSVFCESEPCEEPLSRAAAVSASIRACTKEAARSWAARNPAAVTVALRRRLKDKYRLFKKKEPEIRKKEGRKTTFLFHLWSFPIGLIEESASVVPTVDLLTRALSAGERSFIRIRWNSKHHGIIETQGT